MYEIRVRYTVNQKAAILAGQKFYGDMETSIDPATLTQEQRSELTECNRVSGENDKQVYHLQTYWPGSDEPVVGTTDNQHIVMLLDARIKSRQVQIEKTQKELNDLYAQLLSIMQSDKRPEVLKSILSGKSFYSSISIYYSNKDAVNKWWMEHQAEYAAEMDAIRDQQDLEKRKADDEYKKRLEQKTTEVLNAGIDGILERDSGAWALTKYVGGDFPSSWQDRGISEVINLISQAKAEAERRNEAEQSARQSQIAAYVAEKGTENQKGRHALGLLPEDEVLDAMRDEAFRLLDSFDRYVKIKKGDLDHDEYCYCESGIDCSVDDAEHLTAEQYDVLSAIQKAAPQGAAVEALYHECECKECDAKLTRTSAHVSITVGAFTFTREYAL